MMVDKDREPFESTQNIISRTLFMKDIFMNGSVDIVWDVESLPEMVKGVYWHGTYDFFPDKQNGTQGTVFYSNEIC